MQEIFGRSPEQIRDDIAEMLLDEFAIELEQLGVSFDDLLAMDSYQIATFARRDVQKQYLKNQAKEDARRSMMYTLGGTLLPATMRPTY